MEALRSRLRQQNPSGYLLQVPLPDGGYLVGVSPELLIRRHEYTVQSNPLAGSPGACPIRRQTASMRTVCLLRPRIITSTAS